LLICDTIKVIFGFIYLGHYPVVERWETLQEGVTTRYGDVFDYCVVVLVLALAKVILTGVHVSPKSIL
jgi:hypothetical protein